MNERLKTLGHHVSTVLAMTITVLGWMVITAQIGSLAVVALPLALYLPMVGVQKLTQRVAPLLIVRNRSLLGHLSNIATVTVTFVFVSLSLFETMFSLFDPFWYDVLVYLSFPSVVAYGMMLGVERATPHYEEVRARIINAISAVVSR